MIVEIVGPAGAGKTTIAQAVSARSAAIQSDFDIRFSDFLPSFFTRAVLSLPLYLLRYGKNGFRYWQSLRQIVYLEKLQSVLSTRNRHDGRALLLDQSAVYWLTYLDAFGFRGIRNQKLEKWWRQSILDWARLLDIVIWVDASDEVLFQRILNRKKHHGVKNLSQEKAKQFLTHHRKAYKQVIAMLTSDGGPRVLSFATDLESFNWIEDRILEALDPGGSAVRSDSVEEGRVEDAGNTRYD